MMYPQRRSTLYKLIYYQPERGNSPFFDFWTELDKKARAKVGTFLSILAEHGPNLKRPYADHVRGKIRELRVPYRSNQYRVLYFFWRKGQIILVHAFSKKTWKIQEKELVLAERRMDDGIRRNP